MKKQLLILLCILTGFVGMRAQTNIANYTFASSSGTYTPISGGIILGTSANDEQVFNNNAVGATAPVISTGFPIGFNFMYGGVSYDKFAVSSNGYIILGTGTFTIASSTIDILSNATNAGRANAIAAFNSNLVGQTGAELSYLLTGSSPNQKLIVQWKNYQRYSFSANSGNLNFQIILNESSNVVNIVYGSYTAPSTNYSAQVGLRGVNSTFSVNVNSLLVDNIPAGTTCGWIDAVTANTSARTMYFYNTSVAPSNGLTFTWAPPVNPSLAPVRAFSAVTNTTQTSGTINWTAPTGATQYNLQYRVPGTCGWTNFSGNPVSTTSATLTGLTQSTNYQIRVQSSDGTNTAIWSHIPNAAGTGDGYTTTGTFKTLDPPCITPTSQPTSIVFGGVTNSAISGTFTAATPTVSNYLVIRTLGTAPNTPTNGTVYTTGSSTALGGTVVSVGSGTTFTSSSSIVGNTNYAYYIYSFNNTGCTGGPLYNTEAPLTTTITTCPAKATALTTTLVTTNSFGLTWTAPVGGTAAPITYSVEVSTNSAFTAPISGSPFLLQPQLIHYLLLD